MKSSLLKLTSFTLFSLFSSFAQSASVTFSFQSTLQFDSTLVIASGGQTVGDVMDSIYGTGTGAEGNIDITGSLTYDDSTPAFQQVVGPNGEGVSAFLSPITGLQINIAGTTVNANIASINGNNDLSELGVGIDVMNDHSVSCLDVLVICEADYPGLAVTRTSNTAMIIDNEQLTGNATGDAIAFGLGLTGIANDFSPGFDTGALGLGDVFVDGFGILLVGKLGTQLWDGHTMLPGTNEPFDPANFELTKVVLGFNGDNISGFSAEGTLSAVPIPATVWLLGTGLLGLFGIAMRKARS